MLRIKRRLLPLVAAAIVAVAGLGLARPASAQTGWHTVDGAMSSGAAMPAMVALPDGRVLVMGGQDLTTAPLDAVHVYDSASKAWLPDAAPMNRARLFTSAVLLQDGRALIVGGIDSVSTLTATAEIYDPASNTWTLTADTGRRAHGPWPRAARIKSGSRSGHRRMYRYRDRVQNGKLSQSLCYARTLRDLTFAARHLWRSPVTTRASLKILRTTKNLRLIDHRLTTT